MEFIQKIYKNIFENEDVASDVTSDNSSPNDDSNYYNKYMKYKKKYAKKIHMIGGTWGKFDITISGETNPTGLYQSAGIFYYNKKYHLSLNVPIPGVGPVSYPLELQDGRVFNIDTKNGNKVITFKYKDEDVVKVLEFRVTGSLRKRFSITKDNYRINII